MTTFPITIRKASLNDVKKLSILYKQVYIQTYGAEGVSDEFANFITVQFSESRLEQVLSQYPDLIIVAEHKNNLVGVLELALEKPCPVENIAAPELNKLYILEWFCGKNIGTMLLDEAEKNMRESGFKEMWLWVLHSNHRAIIFYKKHNYTPIGEAFFQMETNSYRNIVMLKHL